MSVGKFANQYGHFSEDGREYIITRPDTPAPWVNVISNGDYGLVVSQAGGGFSWRTHSNFNRITRWNQDLVQDQWGKFIYIRDRQSAELWSAAFQPVRNRQAQYRCIHGLGYTRLECRKDHIFTQWTLFAASQEPLEIWLLTLKNNGEKRRLLSLFTYFEWCLGFAPDNHREFHKAFLETEFVEKEQVLLARKRLWEVIDEQGRHWNREWPYTAFHAVSEKITGYDGDKELFVGPYGDLLAPASVAAGSCQNSQGKWGDAMASLHVEVALSAGEERTIAFVLGAADNDAAAIQTAKKYCHVATAQQELHLVQHGWLERLAPLQVQTPDESLNFLTNTWLKYQAISSRMWARTAYYQQSGAFGFRDQLQDSLLMLPLEPSTTRRQILLHAAHQFVDGSVLHWWHPLTETGLHSNVSDNLLWLPFVVAEYLKETADLTLLDEKAPYFDQSTAASIWEHCCKAIARGLNWRSKRGLPLIGDHDWNDGLNAVGNGLKGESIWLGHFLFKILQEFAILALRRDEQSLSEEWTRAAADLALAINRHGWDGEWFWRASRDDGELVGSKTCQDGKIFLNAQTWAVISSSTTPERQQQAMASVEKHLAREFGPILLWPAYSKPDANIGYISRYAPGRRENGGLYTHAATWAIWAMTLLGEGDKAWNMYCRFNPIKRGMQPDLYRVEPYVTPGNVEGPDSPYFGRGGWTWYTGSAAWLFKVGLEAILGIRPVWDGLQIDPCIPSAWEGFSVTRLFRGAKYIIQVKNPQQVQKGVLKAEVDGKEQSVSDGTLLVPVFATGSEHHVLIQMGKR